MSRSSLSGKWNKKILCLMAVLVVLMSALIVLAIYNYKSIKSAENNFIPAEITNAVQEKENDEKDPDKDNEESVLQKDFTWYPDESNNSYTAQKQVRILNVDKDDENNTDAYIRVCIIPRWIRSVQETDVSQETEIDITNVAGYTEFGNLTDITINKDNTYCMGDVTFTLDKDWKKYWIFNETDGYFYYKNIVPPGESTEWLLESVSIKKDTYDSIDEDVFLRVDIISDSIQTDGGAVDNRWEASGITINATDKTLTKAQETD